MRYVDDSKQELLVSTTQFPALVIAHQSYDKARYHWHSGLEVLYAKDCPMSVVVNGAMTVLQPGQAHVIPPEAVHAVHMVKDEDRGTTPQALSVTVNPVEMSAFLPRILQAQRQVDYDRCNRHGGVAFAPLCDEIYDQLVGASQMKYVNANAAFFALMGRIFDDFMQSKAIDGPDDGDSQSISLIYRYARDHFLSSITTSEAARHFGYSREYFSRLFKNIQALRLWITSMSYDSKWPANGYACPMRTSAKWDGWLVFPNERGVPKRLFERKFGLTPGQWRDIELSHNCDDD